MDTSLGRGRSNDEVHLLVDCRKTCVGGGAGLSEQHFLVSSQLQGLQVADIEVE